MKIRNTSIITTLAILLIFTGCTGDQTTTQNKMESSPAVEIEGSMQEFEMESFTEVVNGNYRPQYSLKNITVKKGDTVRIKITTTSGKHDFKIDELNVYSETPINETTTIEFVADTAGKFVYYCTKPNHRKNGHWGTLIVTEEGESTTIVEKAEEEEKKEESPEAPAETSGATDDASAEDDNM